MLAGSVALLAGCVTGGELAGCVAGAGMLAGVGCGWSGHVSRGGVWLERAC